MEDVVGKRYGNFIINRISGKNKRYQLLVECLCDCGNTKIIRLDHIKSGWVSSCGCLKSKSARKRSKEKLGNKYNASFNGLYTSYRKRAKKIDLEFKLSKEEFYNLNKQNCYYCGIEPLQVRREKGTWDTNIFLYNGIDRLDNNYGYSLENCVPCCKTCNYAKHMMTLDEFFLWIKRVYEKRYEWKQ